MPDWRFRLVAYAPQRTASRDFKDCFRETRKPTRGTRALPGGRFRAPAICRFSRQSV